MAARERERGLGMGCAIFLLFFRGWFWGFGGGVRERLRRGEREGGGAV